MKHFLKEWDRASKKYSGKHFCVFMDFDGTLAPIRKRPDWVKLGGATRNTLKKLARRKDMTAAIVSGRGLKDIRARAGVKGLIYVGNHGLEAEGPGIRYVVPEAQKAKKTIAALSKKFKKEYRKYKGVYIEDKGLSLSIHYRMVRPSGLKKVKEIFNDNIRAYEKSKKVFITRGKKVWEVRPPVRWDKGRMVRFLLEKKIKHKNALPIYMGDDRTDEDAFRSVRNRGYAVKVTGDPGERSRADYYLKNTGEVRQFLKMILK